MSATRKLQPSDIFERPGRRTLDVTISANKIASNHTDLNPYDVRNHVLLEEEKARICEEKGKHAPASRLRGFFVRYDSTGQTRMDKGCTAEQLEQDGERDSKHRRALDCNLRKAGTPGSTTPMPTTSSPVVIPTPSCPG